MVLDMFDVKMILTLDQTLYNDLEGVWLDDVCKPLHTVQLLISERSDDYCILSFNLLISLFIQ